LSRDWSRHTSALARTLLRSGAPCNSVYPDRDRMSFAVTMLDRCEARAPAGNAAMSTRRQHPRGLCEGVHFKAFLLCMCVGAAAFIPAAVGRGSNDGVIEASSWARYRRDGACASPPTPIPDTSARVHACSAWSCMLNALHTKSSCDLPDEPSDCASLTLRGPRNKTDCFS
jgi:hypothetical protein